MRDLRYHEVLVVADAEVDNLRSLRCGYLDYEVFQVWNEYDVALLPGPQVRSVDARWGALVRLI